jgi:3-oxoacyl-[acyl-carrier-protein] synthase III
MKILAVEHAVPTKLLTNDWVLEQLRTHNQERFTPDVLASIEAEVAQYFASAGTRVRYKLDTGERAIDLVVEAGRRALDGAGLSGQNVDLLIYVGVGRGWIEPAMANAVQAELQLGRATCFDIIDACASWLRALHIAHVFLRTGTYRCAMIVNCESGFVTYADWALESVEDLECRIAGWTLGEAATATVISAENERDDFYFNFKNFGQYFDLCMVPLTPVATFLRDSGANHYVPFRFFSLSRKLVSTATARIVETYKADLTLQRKKYDICFGHAASEKAVEVIGRRLRLPPEIHYATHPSYGNTVSSSVPLGISLAFKEQRLHRGSKVLVVVGGSGLTVGLASFTF